jgi:hypothetical protein
VLGNFAWTSEAAAWRGHGIGLRPAHVLWLIGFTSACDAYFVCAPPDAHHVERLPERLSETGLYAGPEQITDTARAYRPRFEFWSDGASKRRWIWLPVGAQIDTSEADDWRFPEGTKFWKEFTRDGVRIETRLLQKTGPSEADWSAVAYVWRPDGSDAIAAPYGVVNAAGTAHDVPGAGECFACHGGRKSGALGFSLLQLAYPADEGNLDMRQLDDASLVSAQLPGEVTLPGDAIDREALGYLHGNCGHCHNQARPRTPGPRCYDPENALDFWLQLDRLGSVGDTPSYHSAAGTVIKPGRPGQSRLLQLVSRRDVFDHMPPLATEVVDQHGVAALRTWIAQLR